MATVKTLYLELPEPHHLSLNIQLLTSSVQIFVVFSPRTDVCVMHKCTWCDADDYQNHPVHINHYQSQVFTPHISDIKIIPELITKNDKCVFQIKNGRGHIQ